MNLIKLIWEKIMWWNKLYVVWWCYKKLKIGRPRAPLLLTKYIAYLKNVILLYFNK